MKRASPNGLRRLLRNLATRHDFDLAVRQQIGKCTIGKGELEHDRALIGRVHGSNHVEVACRRRCCRRIEQAAEHGDHIGRAHHGAVVELDALAQGERPGLQIIAERPFFGEIGLDPLLLVHSRQTVEDEVRIDVLVADGGEHWIEMVRAGAESEAKQSVCCPRCGWNGKRQYGPGQHGRRLAAR